MKIINSKIISEAIFNITNSIIFGATVVSSAAFFTWYGSAVKPIVFGSVVMAFSTLYTLLFSSQPNDSSVGFDKTEILKLVYETHDNLTPIIKELIDSLTNLKQKSQINSKFLIVSKFTDEICNFEQMIPNLVRSYRKGAKFLKDKAYQITTEIKNVEYKLNTSTGVTKETYEKVLEEKRQTLKEMQDIQDTLDQCESKLHYILSTLEKIEATVESSDLKDTITDEDTENINQQLESFSESIKDVVKLMKL